MLHDFYGSAVLSGEAVYESILSFCRYSLPLTDSKERRIKANCEAWNGGYPLPSLNLKYYNPGRARKDNQGMLLCFSCVPSTRLPLLSSLYPLCGLFYLRNFPMDAPPWKRLPLIVLVGNYHHHQYSIIVVMRRQP